MKRPLFAVGIAFLTGTVVAVLFLGQYSFLAGIICLCVGGICSFFGGERLHPLGVILLSFAVSFGIYTHFYTTKYLPALSLDSQRVELTGTVLEAKIHEGHGKLLVAGNVSGVEQPQRVQVYTKQADAITAGDQVRLKTTLQKLPQHYNGNYHRFSKGIFLEGYAEGGIEVLENRTGVRAHILHLRERYIHALQELLPKDVFAVSASMTLGQRQSLEQGQEQVFYDAGIIHLSVVSGTHLVVVTAILSAFLALRPISMRKASAITIAFVLFFMVFTGLTFSVCRAGIMLILMEVGKLFGREGDSRTSWGVAAVILISATPYGAVNIGFLTSMLSCLGIILFSDRIYLFLRGKPYEVGQGFLECSSNWVAENLSISFAAHALILPILIFIFGVVPIVSPITTLIVGWLLPPLFVFSPLGVLANQAGIVFIAKFIGAAITIIIRLIMGISSAIAALPFSTFDSSKNYILVWVVLSYIFLAILFLLKASSTQKLCGIIISVFVLSLGSLTDALVSGGVVELTKIQDALVITEGNRAAVIGSLSSEYDSNQVIKFLKRRGIHALDLAVVTSSTDKALGYVYLFEEVDTHMVLVGDEERYSPHIKKLVGEERMLALNHAEIRMFRGIEVYNKVDTEGRVTTVLQIGDKNVLKSNDSYDILLGKNHELSLVIAGENYLYKQEEGSKFGRNLYSDCVVSFRY